MAVNKVKGFLGLTKEKKVDRIVNNEIKVDKRRAAKQFKILLLGTGDSGKSTVFKQMKFLYGTEPENSVTNTVLEDSVTPCFNSLILDTQQIVMALTTEKKKYKIPSDFPDLSVEGTQAADVIKPLSSVGLLTKAEAEGRGLTTADRGYSAEAGLNPEVADAIAVLYNDPTVTKVWEECRSLLQVSESWAYFAKKITEEYPKFGGKGWVPTDEEYLLIRMKTTGVKQCEFSVENIKKGRANDVGTAVQMNKNDPKLVLIDVGGQKSERRKWVSLFEGVPVVLFVTAISEYDQVMYEDFTKNRLSDSLDVFEQTVTNPAFLRTNFILFLNKSDLFKDKLCERKVPLNISGDFPDAPNTFDYAQGIDWVQLKFQERFNVEVEGRKNTNLYIHITTATDRTNASVVLESVRHTVLETVINPWFGESA